MKLHQDKNHVVFLKLSIFVTLGKFNRSRHRSESDILLLVILPIISRAKRPGKLLNRKELDLADVRWVCPVVGTLPTLSSILG